jgi:hypothetical protein
LGHVFGQPRGVAVAPRPRAQPRLTAGLNFFEGPASGAGRLAPRMRCGGTRASSGPRAPAAAILVCRSVMAAARPRGVPGLGAAAYMAAELAVRPAGGPVPGPWAGDPTPICRATDLRAAPRASNGQDSIYGLQRS